MATKNKSNTTFEYEYECVCGYLVSKGTFKAKETLKRLHEKRCEEAKTAISVYNDIIKPNDKHGRPKKIMELNYGEIDKRTYHISQHGGKTEITQRKLKA